MKGNTEVLAKKPVSLSYEYLHHISRTDQPGVELLNSSLCDEKFTTKRLTNKGPVTLQS
jgi:hypothetical protein